MFVCGCVSGYVGVGLRVGGCVCVCVCVWLGVWVWWCLVLCVGCVGLRNVCFCGCEFVCVILVFRVCLFMCAWV